MVVAAATALLRGWALSQERYQDGVAMVASELDSGHGVSLQENRPLVPVGNLNTARHLHTATLLPNGFVLVTGGYSDFGVTSHSELYDPATQTWRYTGDLANARVLHTATLLPNGNVLVAGGNSATTPPDFGANDTAELYESTTGTWIPTGSLAGRTTWHASTLLPDGRVLLCGGWGGDTVLSKAELFDPQTGNWTPTGSLVRARYGHTATLLATGKVLVVGGSDDGDLASCLRSAELYDPKTGIWTLAKDLNVPRVAHSATLLPDGKVLVAGGYDWPPLSNRVAEIYDPAENTWQLVANLNEARDSHTATPLPGGNVLIVGGYDWGPRVLRGTAELYNQMRNDWSVALGIVTERNRHTATLLNNGMVLIAGGADWNRSLSSTLLLDPGLFWPGEGLRNKRYEWELSHQDEGQRRDSLRVYGPKQ